MITRLNKGTLKLNAMCNLLDNGEKVVMTQMRYLVKFIMGHTLKVSIVST
jgi:hypothetical protein